MKNKTNSRNPFDFSAIKHKRLASIYWSAEEKCRRFAKQMIAFVLFQQTAYVSALFMSVYCICVGNFDTSTYYLPLHLAPPFQIDALYKWYLFWAIQVISAVAYLGGTIIVAVYFVCCCFYLHALCDHFDHLIETVDGENSINARRVICDAIDHHNKIYK